MSKKKRPLRILIWVSLVLALFSVFSAFLAYQSRSSFIAVAKKTEGIIIGLEPQRKAFRPIVAFTTEKGEKISFVGSTAQEDTTDIKVGTKVSVLYHPKSPEIAEVNAFWNIWFSPIIMLVFGVTPFFFLLFLRWVFTSRPKDETTQATP